MTGIAPLLAHYGGVDEIGVFLVPAVAVILVLRWAERRARRRAETGSDESEAGDPSPQVPDTQ